MASNFFQRWSSRSLTAKDKAVKESTDANEVAVEPLEPELVIEHIDEVNTELNETVIADEATHNVDDSAAMHDVIADKVSDEALTIKDADSVTFDSGVASFLQHGVDKSVKKAALAKLFHADEFNYISDMDDHTEDFSNIPKLDDNIAQQLRGWVKTVLEEPEPETELASEAEPVLEADREQQDDRAEDCNVEQIAAVMPADEDENVATRTADCPLVSDCDGPHNKTFQQGET